MNKFSFVAFACILSGAYAIECYTCFYDAAVPDVLPTSEKNCIAQPFKGEGVKKESGFQKCYKAVTTKNDKLLGARRGGGSAALGSFAEMASRDFDQFGISYCKTDLCNGASKVTTFFAIITSLMTILSYFIL